MCCPNRQPPGLSAPGTDPRRRYLIKMEPRWKKKISEFLEMIPPLRGGDFQGIAGLSSDDSLLVGVNSARATFYEGPRAVKHRLDEPGQMSGKAMARTGLRMMPTFPSPPLKFRTAGFPQYGFKAGLSEGAFPREAPNCRAHPVCVPPSRSSLSTCMSRSVSGPLGAWALPFE